MVSQLEHIYEDSKEKMKSVHEARFKEIKSRFQKVYSTAPQFFARAPGRVNIIGEHIDYCGYSVLPTALEQDFIMAYSITDEKTIEINNIE